MNPIKLREAVKFSLAKDADSIFAHIKSLPENRYTGTEKLFETAMRKTLGIVDQQQIRCSAIGTENYFPRYSKDGSRVKDGWVDLVHPNTKDPQSAFELKAVRMPRKKADCCFDVSQITSDYLRLSKASKIDAGWVIAFVYGPMVDDASSDGDLMRRFHNQMFIETALSRLGGRLEKLGPLHTRATRELGWNEAQEKAGNRKGAFGCPPSAFNRQIGCIK